jgi:hypothetical protein
MPRDLSTIPGCRDAPSADLERISFIFLGPPQACIVGPLAVGVPGKVRKQPELWDKKKWRDNWFLTLILTTVGSGSEEFKVSAQARHSGICLYTSTREDHQPGLYCKILSQKKKKKKVPTQGPPHVTV